MGREFNTCTSSQATAEWGDLAGNYNGVIVGKDGEDMSENHMPGTEHEHVRD